MKSAHDPCAEVEGSLPLWVGGDLDPAARAAVELHIRACERCSALARSALAARDALRAGLAGSPRSGRDLWPPIRATLRAEGRLHPALSEPRLPELRRAGARSLPRRLWPVAAAAAVVLGVWIGVRLAQPSPIEPAPVAGGPGLPGIPGFVDDARVPAGALPVEPVSLPGSLPVSLAGGLRRLRQGEPRLSDDAVIFGLEPVGQNETSPASLERVFQRR